MSEVFKTRGTWWWMPPPETPINAPIPYVAPSVELTLSTSEQRVLRVITNLKLGAKKQTSGGFVCDPGGYDRIAKKAGVCRNTASNVVKSLIAKGALRLHQLVTHGGQRIKTIYFAPFYGDVLAVWRADDDIFKTIRGAVVVRGRAKTILTVEDARKWSLDPRRAPKSGCGQGSREEQTEETHVDERREPAQAAAPSPPPMLPDPGADAELEVIREAFESHCPANLQDVIDLLAAARNRFADLPVQLVVEGMASISADYKPNRMHPKPKPKWFIDRIGGYIAHRLRKQTEQFMQTSIGAAWREEDIVLYFEHAIGLLNSGRASPREAAKCKEVIAEAEREFPSLLQQALTRLSPAEKRMAG